jgi:hypothetical protein
MKETDDPLLEGESKKQMISITKKIIRYYTFITDNY